MVLRTENGRRWSEVVWGLKSLPKSGRKVAEKHLKEGWWWLAAKAAVEERGVMG